MLLGKDHKSLVHPATAADVPTERERHTVVHALTGVAFRVDMSDAELNGSMILWADKATRGGALARNVPIDDPPLAIRQANNTLLVGIHHQPWWKMARFAIKTVPDGRCTI